MCETREHGRRESQKVVLLFTAGHVDLGNAARSGRGPTLAVCPQDPAEFVGDACAFYNVRRNAKPRPPKREARWARMREPEG